MNPEILRIKIKEESEAEQENAYIVGRFDKFQKSKKERPKFKCHKCKQVGHKAVDCRSPAPAVAMMSKETTSVLFRPSEVYRHPLIDVGQPFTCQ